MWNVLTENCNCSYRGTAISFFESASSVLQTSNQIWVFNEHLPVTWIFVLQRSLDPSLSELHALLNTMIFKCLYCRINANEILPSISTRQWTVVISFNDVGLSLGCETVGSDWQVSYNSGMKVLCFINCLSYCYYRQIPRVKHKILSVRHIYENWQVHFMKQITEDTL